MSVRERDNGAQALLRRVRHPVTVRVGIFGSEAAKDHGGLTNVEVASFHEFGLGVPPRPFISQPIDRNEEDLKRRLRKAGELVIKGTHTTEQALELFGIHVTDLMKDAISNREYQANAPATVQRKGSSTPLVNTGQLRNSITHEVKRA
jgi:phage gpG-like protein